MRDQGDMRPLREAEAEETVVKVCCMREDSIFNNNKNNDFITLQTKKENEHLPHKKESPEVQAAMNPYFLSLT